MQTTSMESPDAIDRKKLGANLERILEERDMTQEELAFLSGTKQTMISRYKNGKANPDLKTLLKLATGLKVRLEVLVKGIDMKFDAMYQELCAPVMGAESDNDRHETTEPPELSTILHSPAPAGGTHDTGISDLVEAKHALRRAASDLLSIIDILPAGPDSMVGGLGSGIRSRAALPRTRPRQKSQTTTTQEKRR